MKKYLLYFLFIFTAYSTVGQEYDKKTFKNKFQDAEYFFLFEDYKSALPIFLELYEMDSTNSNINYKIGVCYTEDKLLAHHAIGYLEKAVNNISTKYKASSYKERGAHYDAYYYLGKALQRDFEFDRAIEAFKKYETYLKVDDLFEIEKNKKNIEACHNAKELLVQSALNFVKVDIFSEEINSPYPDYTPVISGDGKTLIFTSRRRYRLNKQGDVKLQDMDVPDEFYMEDIYMSKLVDGKWTKAVKISKNIRSDVYTSVVSVSHDGKKLFLIRKDILTGNEDEGNIYMSEWNGTRWMPMKKLNKNINTDNWETHASLSKDETKLYFTSVRDEGYGGLDIYVSTIDESGDWGPAINLGENINTPLDEEYPFILADGVTLYFSSQGHYNIGGHDIFYSKKTEDGEWSTPINLGYPINTMDDDAFYCPMNDGKSALVPLVTNEGFGDVDIYKIDISESTYGDFGSQEFSSQKTDSSFFPCNLADLYSINERIDSSSIRKVIKYDEVNEGKIIPVASAIKTKKLTIKGRIILSDNNVVDTTFSLKVNDANVLQTVTLVTPEVETGKYHFNTTLEEFTIYAEGEGYQPVTKKVVIPDDYSAKEMVIDIYMEAIQVASGEYFTIKSIFFDYGKSDLRRESQIELEKLYSLMETNPSLYIEVTGHTDSWSSSEFNLKLSKARARAAIDYLVNKGISVERFVAKGMGEDNPLAINANPDGTDNPDGRQFNRRVDVKILKTNDDHIIVEDVYIPENLRFSGRPSNINNKYYILILKQKDKYTKQISLTYKEHKTKDGYAYTVGEFNDKASALKSLTSAIDLGFNDAKIIDTKELNRLAVAEQPVTNQQNTDTQQGTTETANNTSSNQTKVYAIQVKALSSPIDISMLKGLKGVKEYLGADGYYRYTYMEFSSREEATLKLQSIKELGYTDAFVIDVNRYKLRETQGNAEYTIQIKAMKTPLNMKYFNNIQGVKEIIANDGYYKYIYGKYNKIDDARKALKKVKKKGYPDAFIVNLEKYN